MTFALSFCQNCVTLYTEDVRVAQSQSHDAAASFLEGCSLMLYVALRWVLRLIAPLVLCTLFAACHGVTAAPTTTLTTTPATATSVPVVATMNTPISLFTTAPVATEHLSLGVTNFSGARNIVLKQGHTLVLVDPADGGGEHYIVIGQNGIFSPQPGAPSSLNTASGVHIRPGETISVVFNQPGIFTLTCLPHPGMLAQITVTL